MTTEIQNPSSYPYSATLLLVATFPNGQMTFGTGALVGRNDVLTATHMLYAPDYGGWAIDLDLYAGVDFNGYQQRFESTPLLTLEQGFSWNALAYPDLVFRDDDPETLTFAESQYDVALIGLSEAIGDTLGWFNLSSNSSNQFWATQLGYPTEGTGLMTGDVQVTANSLYSVYSTYDYSGSTLMGSGSSGGPLYVYDDQGTPSIVGVKSSGSDYSNHWADISLVYQDLLSAINENDELLPVSSSTQTHYGSEGNDHFIASENAPEVFVGGSGADTLVLSEYRDQYLLTQTDSGWQLGHQTQADVSIQLEGIERLEFADGTLALDTEAWQVAGSAYRLYQAAFDRTPDTEGLNYWVSVMDQGTNLMQVSEYFMQSPEYRGIYGASPTQEELLTALYQNALDRAPDAEGYEYWLTQMQAGLPDAEVMAYFSESPENQQQTQAETEWSIWLG